MNPSVAATESRAGWLKAPELTETMARVERGEATPEDVQRLTEAAPTEQRGIIAFMVRAVRAVRVLEAVRDRKVDEVMALSRLALDANDVRAAVEAVRMIVDNGLLDEPVELRPVGCDADDPDSGLKIDLANDAILAHDLVSLPSCERALVAIVVDRDRSPQPEPADPERIARELARGLVAQVSR